MGFAIRLLGGHEKGKSKEKNLEYFEKSENSQFAEKLRNALAEWIDNRQNNFEDENTHILCVELIARQSEKIAYSAIRKKNCISYDICYTKKATGGERYVFHVFCCYNQIKFAE